MADDTRTTDKEQVEPSADPRWQGSGMRERDETDEQRQEDRRADQLKNTAGEDVEDTSQEG